MLTVLGAAACITMYQNQKQISAENEEKVKKYIEEAPKADEKRMLKKNLSLDLWNELKVKRTPSGSSLWDCLKSGILRPDSKMGIYACDRESYDVFEKIFEPMILQYFNTKEYHPAHDYGDLSKKEVRDMFDLAAVDTEGIIQSTRVRVARNLEKYAYAAGLAPEERLKVEKEIVDATKKFSGDQLAGEYVYMKDLSQEKQDQMVTDHLLFHNRDEYIRDAGMFGDWPNGRGAFYNKDKSLMIWVNEEDHMRIISLQKGNNLLQVYERLIGALQTLDKHVKVATHKKWGFLASCPTNLGTGLRASVHIKIPRVAALDCFHDLCNDMRIDIRGIGGEHTESVGGVYDISNRRRFGLSEYEALTEMARGVKNLIRLENALKKIQG